MIRGYLARRKMRKAEHVLSQLSPQAKAFLLEHSAKLLGGWSCDMRGNWYPPTLTAHPHQR